MKPNPKLYVSFNVAVKMFSPLLRDFLFFGPYFHLFFQRVGHTKHVIYIISDFSTFKIQSILLHPNGPKIIHY